jgi:hypothetical protein
MLSIAATAKAGFVAMHVRLQLVCSGIALVQAVSCDVQS